MKKICLSIFTCLLLMIWLKAGYSQSGWMQTELDGKKAPIFELMDTTGKMVSLSSLKGKVVLVNFWATKCPPCIAEMPSLNTLYQTYKDKGLIVLAISTDRNVYEVKDVAKANGLEFIILFDNNHEVKNKYKVFALPTSFIINKEGLIGKTIIGGRNWMDESSISLIENLL